MSISPLQIHYIITLPNSLLFSCFVIVTMLLVSFCGYVHCTPLQ